MGEVDAVAIPEPTVLIVGDGEPLLDGIAHAAGRHGLVVERSDLAACAQAAVAVAPDAVLLVGDAVKDGGVEALRLLSGSPLAAVVPVVLFGDERQDLGERLAAFRLGATAYVSRSASVDATARRLTELVREIPDRSGPQVGRVGEATLDSFLQTVARELRNGILSVRGVDAKGSGEEIRIVLGEGVGLNEAIHEFIGRVEKLIERTEVVDYEWQEDARGVSFLTGTDEPDEKSRATITGARVLLADDDVARADVVAQELRGLGAQVAVVDPQGRGLARARALDPQALVVGRTVVQGPGMALVRRLRTDARMRWAHMIVVPWDEVWTDGEAPPELASLARRIARATKVENAIRDRIATKKSFDVRLEALGPARLLRQLALEQETVRLTVWNLRGTVRIDVGQGLVIGARAMVPGKSGGVREGTAGLACLLPMASGRARIEHVTSPMTTNVMSPVEVALGQAEGDVPAGLPEAPPHTLQQKAGGSMYPVAVAKTNPPPARDDPTEVDVDGSSDVGLDSVPPDEVVPTPAIVVAPSAESADVAEPLPSPPEKAEPPPKRVRRVPRPTMQGVAPPASSASTASPAAQATPAAGVDRLAALSALVMEATKAEAEQEPEEEDTVVESKAVDEERVVPPPAKLPAPAAAPAARTNGPRPRVAAPAPPAPPPLPLRPAAQASAPVPAPRAPITVGVNEAFEITIADSVAPAAIEPAREKRRRWVWPVAALTLLCALAGAAWWTGYPPELFRLAGVSPRTGSAEDAHASRPPIVARAGDPTANEQPANEQPVNEQPATAEPAAEPEATTESTADDTSDSEFATRERPARPHRPPTPLHPIPDGADASFRVPEWMSELGPITRGRRSRELRDVAQRNLRSRRYDRALTWYRRSWWFQADARTATGIARTFMALGDSAEAERWARHGATLDPDDADPLLALGDALRTRGQLGQARAAYRQALEVEPRNREARRNLRTLRRQERAQRRRPRAD